MRPIALFLAVVPGLALAAPSPAKFAAGPRAIELPATVQTPLYRSPATGELPAVWADFPKDKPKDGEPTVGAVAVIDLAAGPSTIDPALATNLGLKVATQAIAGKPEKYATIPNVMIGDLVLHDVLCLVQASGPPGGATAPGMVLGAASLRGITTAILPSQGVVTFAPGQAAVDAVGAGAVAVVGRRIPTKKWFEQGEETWLLGANLEVPATVLGTAGQATLRTAQWTSGVGAKVPMTSTLTVDGLPAAIDPAATVGVALAPAWFGHDGSITSPDGSLSAVVGYGALYRYDLAVDPATNTLAIRAADTPKSDDPTDKLIAAAQATYDFATQEAAKAPADPHPPDTAHGDPGKPKVVAVEDALANDLLAAGDAANALPHYQAEVAVAGDHCEPYLGLGLALLATGDPAAAIDPLTKAGTLWDRWWKQDLATRTKIEAKKHTKADLQIAQGEACFDAWGYVAGALAAEGKPDAATAIFAAHRDPDLGTKLPLAYGLALLESGKVADANGPIRLALNHGDAVDAHVALASVTPADPAQVEAQATWRMTHAPEPTLVDLAPLIEAERRAAGDAAAADLARRLAATDPLNVAAALLASRESLRAGGAPGALNLAEEEAKARPNSPATVAHQALARALTGDSAGAAALLDGLAAAKQQDPEVLVARALLASIAGDAAAADAAIARLRHVDPLSPASAVDFTPGS